MIRQFHPLQNCPSPLGFNVGIFGEAELLKYHLVHTLQSIFFSCRDFHRRLGRGLKFEVEARYHQCQNGTQCTCRKLKWSGRYDEFKGIYKDITDY